MAEWLSAAPTDYQAIAGNIPEGWQMSERLVEPLLRIIRTDDRFCLQLHGRRLGGGKTETWKAISLKHNWVVDNHTIKPLPRDIAELVGGLTGSADSNNLSFAKVIEFLRLRDTDVVIEADDNVFLTAGDAANDLDNTTEIPGLNANLYTYQARGVEWMLRTLRHTGGLILADEMGLGKTIQIIALLLSEKPTEQAPALIICPTSLIANWKNEILRFGPELSILIHRGAHRTGITKGLQRAQIILATYDTVVNDQAIFEGLEWSWLICDEAQAVKNPDSNRRKAISALSRRRTIPMTGTPVETSLLNLWSLADLAIPGLLGGRTSFEHDFADTEQSARRLAHYTDPVILRRRVRDVAGDLPDRIDIDIPLELGDELSDQYDEVLRKTIAKYPVSGALVATGQLQLFCAHPWLQGKSDSYEDEDADIYSRPEIPLITPKIERTVSLLEEAFATGKKVLLFALFNRCGDIIREAAKGLPAAFWGTINGSTPQEERQNIVDQFSKHDGPGCLILNPKAAGAGLNIPAATVVIHYTQAWNPALEAQASARAHRRGQTEPVYIYRLFFEGTVERVMIDRAAWRRELGNEAVPVSTRDREDLERALSIRPGEQTDD